MMVIKARARDMGGDFSVMEGTINPGELLAPHSHRFEDQLVYVITGELEFEVDGANGLRFTAPTGSYVQKPRGIMHTFWNQTNTPVRYIELSGRAGFEGFVDDQKQGTVKGVLESERQWGLTWYLEEIPRLMKENNLSGIAGAETPDLSKLKDVPEPIARLFRKFKVG